MKPIIAATGLISLCLLSMHSISAGTAAGSVIDNEATVSYSQGANTLNTTSVKASITVQELIDATMLSQNSNPVTVNIDETGIPLKFALSNDGNGDESFKIVPQNLTQPEEFNLIFGNIYMDDGDGIFTANNETLLTDATTEVIAAGDAIVIWLVLDTPSGISPGDVSNIQLNAQASSFLGLTNPFNPALGSIAESIGDGGTDAVYGAIKPVMAQTQLLVSEIQVRMSKSIINGTYIIGGRNEHLVPGANVQYQLDVSITGSGAAENLIVEDQLPNELALKAGNQGIINVNGNEYSAAMDEDPASYDNKKIVVNLGDVSAPSTYVIIFTTVIQ